MNMLTVACYDTDGNPLNGLVQWDMGVTVRVSGVESSPTPKVHMSQSGRDKAVIVSSSAQNGGIQFTVPSVILQKGTPIVVYLYYGSGSNARSKYSFTIPIIPRLMPADYSADGDYLDGDESYY